MKVLIVVCAVAFFVGTSARSIEEKAKEEAVDLPKNEELVVESLLHVKSKEKLQRQKRQFGQSSALANANAFNQYHGQNGFGANAANAGAQAFQSQGPLGGFGASAANTQTQGFHAGPGGIQGSAGLAGSQSYNLPGGHNVNLAYGGTYGHNNGQSSGGNSHSISYT